MVCEVSARTWPCILIHPEILYITSEEQEFVSKFARFVTGENVEPIIHELSSAITDIERNGNGRMIFLDMVLKLSGLIKQ